MGYREGGSQLPGPHRELALHGFCVPVLNWVTTDFSSLQTDSTVVTKEGSMVLQGMLAQGPMLHALRMGISCLAWVLPGFTSSN